MARWVNKWQVESSTGDKSYTVSEADDGTFGCSCPVWKFRRQVCKHIVAIQQQLRPSRRVIDEAYVPIRQSQAPRTLDRYLEPPTPEAKPCQYCGKPTDGSNICASCWADAKKRRALPPVPPPAKEFTIRKLNLTD